MGTTTEQRRNTERRTPTRTCVGCGTHESAPVRGAGADMLRLVVADGDVAFDLAGGAFGRGAHVHARLDCLLKAPRGLARSFGKGSSGQRSGVVAGGTPSDLGEKLVGACHNRMKGLLLAARRIGAVAIGADASRDALTKDMAASHHAEGGEADAFAAPLAIVATDAGSIATASEVTRAISAGHAIAWGSKIELGALLGDQAVAICTVRHESIAAELKRMRAAADAGAAAMREGAGCSRCPEAR